MAVGNIILVRIETCQGHTDEVDQVVAGKGQGQGEGAAQDGDFQDAHLEALQHPQDGRCGNPGHEQHHVDVVAHVARHLAGHQARALESLEQGEVEDAHDGHAAPQGTVALERLGVAEGEQQARNVHDEGAGDKREHHRNEDGRYHAQGLARVHERAHALEREGAVGVNLVD